MNFDMAVEYVLQNEGGYINDPNDSGKATNFGVTQQMLAFYRAEGVTMDDVKALTVEEAKEIYKKFYWDHLKLDQLPQAYATAIMDMAVNMGEGTAIRLAQQALGSSKGDGILGPQTVNALLHSDPYEFMFNYVSEIQDHYCDVVKINSKDMFFLKGWLRRALRLFHLIEHS